MEFLIFDINARKLNITLLILYSSYDVENVKNCYSGFFIHFKIEMCKQKISEWVIRKTNYIQNVQFYKKGKILVLNNGKCSIFKTKEKKETTAVI